jgi:hypothetical protein
VDKIQSIALSSGTIEDPEYYERGSNCNIIYVFTSYVNMFTLIISTTVVSIHIFPLFIWELGSRNSAVGIATGYVLDDRGIGVRVPVGSRILSSPRRPDRLWCPPTLLSNEYLRFFPRGKAASAWSWPPTSNQCRSQENLDLYIHSPIRLHCVAITFSALTAL